MTEETNIEISIKNVKEIGESILDHLESIQNKYTELEMICAITTVYNSVISALGDRVDSVEQSDD